MAALALLLFVLGQPASPAEAAGPRIMVAARAEHGRAELAAVTPRSKTRSPAKTRRKKISPPPAGEAPAAAAPVAPDAPAPVLPAPRALPVTYRAVGLLPLAGIDVGLELVHEIEVALLNEIDETPGMRAVTPGDVRNDNAAIGLDPERCDGDVACVARAGRYAGAHDALETRVAALGGTLSISMRIVDTQTASELRRVADTLSDDPAVRANELHRLSVQLLRPQDYIGTLRIGCSQEGAQVYLDDKLVGTTPLPKPLESVRAGPHILRLTKPGYSDLYQFVDVVYRRSSTVEVDLSTTTLVSARIEIDSQSGFGTLLVVADVDGIEIRADGEPKGTTPLDGPLESIPAGKRRLSLRKPGFAPAIREIEITAGKRTDVIVKERDGVLTIDSYEVVDAAAALPGRDLPGSGGSGAIGSPGYSAWRWYAGLAAAGLGAAGLATSAVSAWWLRGLDDDARAQVASLDRDPDGTYRCSKIGQEECQARAAELERLGRSGARAERVQWVALTAGAALALAGGGLLVWDWWGKEPAAATSEPAASLLVAPLPGGGFAGLHLRY